jgi:hypothetical protein
VLSKTKINKENNFSAKLMIVAAWVMMAVTLIGTIDIVRSARQPVVVNTVRPAFSYADDGFNLWNRNDNENETVHLPTKFDVGLRIAAISGR